MFKEAKSFKRVRNGFLTTSSYFLPIFHFQYNVNEQWGVAGVISGTSDLKLKFEKSNARRRRKRTVKTMASYFFVHHLSIIIKPS